MKKWTRNYVLTVQVDHRALDYIDITSPLSLEFNINRSCNASANRATFTILNLAESTRRKIFMDRYQTLCYKGVELRAGYGDDREEWPLIFKGNIEQAFSKRNGVNYETTINAFDGGFAYRNGRTERAFAEGTPDKQIIKTLLNDLPGIKLGAIGDFGATLPRGNSFNGNTMKLLNDISEGHLFIDLEKLNCLRRNEGLQGNLVTLNADSGLLGSPLREESFLTFTMIFEPRLQIGQFVKLESQTETTFNGTYKVIGLQHNGVISGSQSGRCTTKVSLNYIKDIPVIL